MRMVIDFEGTRRLFEKPERIISCYNSDRLCDAFTQVEAALAQGFYAAGFLSYEAGYAFEKKCSSTGTEDFPLLYFGCYRKPRACEPRFDGSGGFRLSDLRVNMTREEYGASIDTIRAHIADGDVYQITYCLKLHFGFSGDPRQLYSTLYSIQPVPYAAYLESEAGSILSLSPELFLYKRGGYILTKPMKGTWPRGTCPESDAAALYTFQNDIKNRAENVMIADLLRNDLGRVATGIHVPRLFEVTPYNTLFQMTSTVAAGIDPNVKLHDLFKAVFPSGSVTGAPRIRAMQIIRGVEREKRNIYTGAIGYIAPDKDLFFNIPIRTLLLRGGHGEMGIGGGIVWDSTAEGEWQEGLLKARFFTDLCNPVNP